MSATRAPGKRMHHLDGTAGNKTLDSSTVVMLNDVGESLISIKLHHST